MASEEKASTSDEVVALAGPLPLDPLQPDPRVAQLHAHG